MDDIASKNYYEVLGVERDATKEQIRDAYREIARIYHPDSNFFNEIVNESLSPEQQSVFKIITAAYNTLTNSAKRAEYDQLLPKDLPTWEPQERWSEAYYMPKDAAAATKATSAALGRFGIVNNPSVPRTEIREQDFEPTTAESKESWFQRFFRRR